GLWTTVCPTIQDLPEQGWKIHVSTTLSDAVKVLDIVWRYCVEREVAFKYLRSERLLLLCNDKNFARARAGKFITIYPRDDVVFGTVLADLDERLAAFPGPYILGDLRHRNGPLHVRYGAFREFYCADGRTLATRDHDGNLVPDVRSPVFTVPDYVDVPEVLAADRAAYDRPAGESFPYDVDTVVRFSNGGGIYLAVDERTGRRVIVREARPHAGLDASGADAVARLHRERWALERLTGLDCVPRLIDYRTV